MRGHHAVREGDMVPQPSFQEFQKEFRGLVFATLDERSEQL
jgi:hypothetical protein